MTSTSEHDARSYLEAAGYVVLPGNHLRPPSPEHDITENEMAAANYLCIEHDYPGFETAAMRKGAAAFRAGAPPEANPYSYEYQGGRPRLEWSWGWEIERGETLQARDEASWEQQQERRGWR